METPSINKNKTCSKCNQNKSIKEFNYKTGICKICLKIKRDATRKKYVPRNPNWTRKQSVKSIEKERMEVIKSISNYERRQKKIYDFNRKTNHPMEQFRKRIRNRLYQSLVQNKSIGSIEELVGCSIIHLKKYIEDQFQPGMNWDNWGHMRLGEKYWQLDHKIPFSTFNLTIPEELLKACHYTNLQPLWTKEHKLKTKKQYKQYK